MHILLLISLIKIMCRKTMETPGPVDGENGNESRRQPGSGDPDDLMDTSVGDEDAGDAPDEEELLKSADSLLGSRLLTRK
jgi:hypothetical protein